MEIACVFPQLYWMRFKFKESGLEYPLSKVVNGMRTKNRKTAEKILILADMARIFKKFIDY